MNQIQSPKKLSWKKISFLIALICSCHHSAFAVTFSLSDTSALNRTEVSQIVYVTNEGTIQEALKANQAQHTPLPISIMSKQHSQGGQTFSQNAIVLDMLGFTGVLSFDAQKKQITVQPGITWDALQQYINPYHLAVQVMQDSYIFSVGGTLSADAHGEDFRTGSIDHTVVAFHLILANGEKVLVTPTLHPDLWKTVLGGYGTLGVISDVTLQLTDNDLLQGHYYSTDIDHFVHYFKQTILPNPDINFFYARLSIAPGNQFLRDIYIITSNDTHKLATDAPLNNPESMDFIIEPIFDWSRNSALGKVIRWDFERKLINNQYADDPLPRNIIMRKPILFATDYHKRGYADWLQEYFIPLDQLPTFVDTLRAVAEKNNINLLNATIRYVPKDNNILLSYAKTDCFSVVLYFEQSLSTTEVEKTRNWTQQLIQAALKTGGNYYLTYQNFATQEQFEEAYPSYKAFEKIKNHYDPQGVFTNQFYQHYFSTSSS